MALPLSFLSVRLSHGETSKVDASSILVSPWYCGNPSQHLIQTGVHKAQGSFISLLTWVRGQWNTNKALAERNCASRTWGLGPQAMAIGGKGAVEGGKEFREDENVLKRHLTFTAFY